MDVSVEPMAVGVLTCRVAAGILFFLQGYDKVFKIGVKGVVETVGPSYKRIGFPDFSIYLISLLTSWIELIAGACFLLGLFTYPAAYLLCFDLLIVISGMSLLDPVWDVKLVLPRLVLVVVYLFIPIGIDVFKLDSFFG
jgi:uncharacterized membrane protein YphA (DoxX/SURF4 family)